MHHCHHNHHNHRIKIVPFNQADTDEAIPNTLQRVIYVQTNCQFEKIWDTCETILCWWTSRVCQIKKSSKRLVDDYFSIQVYYWNMKQEQHRRSRGDMIEMYKILTGKQDDYVSKFITPSNDTYTRGHHLKLYKSR